MSIGPFSCYGWDSGFWFRLFGYGLMVRVASKNPEMFSERYGYTKVLRVFGLYITALKPRKGERP